MSRKVINVVVNGDGGQPVNLRDIILTNRDAEEVSSMMSYGTISSDVYDSIVNATKIDIFFLYGDTREIIIPSTKIKILDGKHYFVGMLETTLIATVISNNEIKQFMTVLADETTDDPQ